MTGVESAVQIHIDRGDDLNARDGDGMTPLMLSAARNKAEICKLLLDAGADRTLLAPSGQTAHAIALTAGAHEAATVLEIARVIHDQGPRSTISELPYAAEGAIPKSARPDIDVLDSAVVPPVGIVGTSCSETYGVSTELEEEVSEFDLSGWEAEEESTPPQANLSIVGAISVIQIAISDHEPIDSSAEWDDIDAQLPLLALPVARTEDAEAYGKLRLLLLRAIREGSVPSADIEDLTVAADHAVRPEAERLLNMVINDLGAESDERFEYTNANESFKVFIKPEETSSEEETLDEALAAIDIASSPRSEPLRIYQREFQRLQLISAQEELELGQAMERALDAALDALAAWPSGIEQILTTGAEVIAGLRQLNSMSSGSVGSDNEQGLSDDSSTTSALIEDEENTFDENDESSAEPRPPMCDPAFANALDRLRAVTIDSAHQGHIWSETRNALAALRLNREFLLNLADSRVVTAIESGIQYGQAMTAYRQARDQMMAANLRLVFHLAQKYQYSGEPLDDLVQEGNIGLLKAIERYDWRRGFKLSTYATWWIRQQIGRHIADKCRTIRIPVHVFEKLQRLQRETIVFESTFGYPPDLGEIASRMEMSPRKIVALQRLTLETLSIDETSIDELIAIEAASDFAVSSPEDIVSKIQLRRAIDNLLATLAPKEAEILRLRFGIGVPDSLTLEEIGQRYSVTRERVRQIESKALRGLRHPNRGGKFAHTVLGIPPTTEKSKEVTESSNGVGTEAVANLDGLLARAVELGITVDDDSEGPSGKIWVNVIDTTDESERRLIEGLIDFGFQLSPGKGYWK
ncbi:sigma-70 family RNA polymerase sigma factor [Burkholderia lata]|uniref:sigma-70 family RNA polymerase sigma factor n=1 Tax=Burkholderia lata (strain ATCC 17760 / DSM 23089 / LMG 22485 / NCIMB 9086 / R18194 / 383) TaxID=482957 RepID=UPI001C2E4CE6|nr:sigma-70 family RNA polymerase sigma factor [Burkholderia lata]